MSNFTMVADMNAAFGNAKGDATNINWPKIQRQCKSIGHEYGELLVALGADKAEVAFVVGFVDSLKFHSGEPVLKDVRDALCDIHVFGYGAHHLMGINADADMHAVVSAVMTRFMKDDNDRVATVAKHAAKGVTDVYVEGHYPTMVLKSGSDQPDAPKGKFLKSASYSEPVFYDVGMERRTAAQFAADEHGDASLLEAQKRIAAEAGGYTMRHTVDSNPQAGGSLNDDDAWAKVPRV